MSKDHIYKLLSHFYGLLVNDFPKTGLVTKGIYEVEQVYEAIESLPSGQEHLIRCEIRQFLATLDQVQKAIEFHLQMKRLEYWRTLRKRFVPFKNFFKEATIFLLNCELLIEEVFYV